MIWIHLLFLSYTLCVLDKELACGERWPWQDKAISFLYLPLHLKWELPATQPSIFLLENLSFPTNMRFSPGLSSAIIPVDSFWGTSRRLGRQCSIKSGNDRSWNPPAYKQNQLKCVEDCFWWIWAWDMRLCPKVSCPHSSRYPYWMHIIAGWQKSYYKWNKL